MSEKITPNNVASEEASQPAAAAHIEGKQTWKPGTLIYPLPAVLVSCGSTPEEYNLLTVAWTGTVCTNPPMCYISVRRERHSYDIIRRTGEFVINLTTEAMARATDWCGVRSGRDHNKWQEANLTPMSNSHVAAPMVAESPLSICCKVRQVIELGSHDMFLADVVGIEADERYIDPATGRFSLESARPIVYSHGEYYTLGELIGHFGWSVRKPIKRAKRRAKQSKKTTK
ncbi:MAG: flavin reductase family protein [Alistipes sp.]|nr:flavin reductase family protein [Alistipes sp.]